MKAKILIAVFVLLAQTVAAQITFTNLGLFSAPDFEAGVNASSYPSLSWTPPSNTLIVLFVYAEKSGGGAASTPTVSGNSLTWTQIGTTLDCGSQHGISTFATTGSSPTTGSTTVDFGGVGQLRCIALFFQVDGADLSGGVAGAFVQTQTNTGSGTSLEIILNAAGSSNNRPIAAFLHFANEGSTARTNWTELDDMSSSEGFDWQSQYRGDAFETTASASWTTSSTCCGRASEIKAAAVGGASAARIIIINQ